MASPKVLRDNDEDNVICMLCWDDKAPDIAKQIGSADVFSTREYQRVAQFALEHIEKYNKPPCGHLRDYLEQEIRHRDGSFLRQLIDGMEALYPQLQGAFVQDRLDRFLEMRRIAMAFDRGYDALNNNDIAAAREALTEAQKPRQHGPLPFIDWANYEPESVRPREWIAEDWIARGVVSALYGPGGIGKTLLAQQLMTATALHGKPWCGIPVAHVKSLGLFCEDDAEELKRRQDNINKLYRCTPQDIAPYVRTIPWTGSGALGVFEQGRLQLTPLYHQLREDIRSFGAELLVLDTLMDIFVGNQNDPNHARHFVQAVLKPIAVEMGGAVLVCAHPSLYGQSLEKGQAGHGSSGTVQWDAAFRSRFFLTTPKIKKAKKGEEEDEEQPDANARVLQRLKANYASHDAEIALYWDEGILAVRGGVDDERPDVQGVFLAILDQTNAAGSRVSADPQAGNYAPKVFALHPYRKGWRKADFERAMEMLFAQGDIIEHNYRKTYMQIIRNPARPAAEPAGQRDRENRTRQDDISVQQDGGAVGGAVPARFWRGPRGAVVAPPKGGQTHNRAEGTTPPVEGDDDIVEVSTEEPLADDSAARELPLTELDPFSYARTRNPDCPASDDPADAETGIDEETEAERMEQMRRKFIAASLQRQGRR